VEKGEKGGEGEEGEEGGGEGEAEAPAEVTEDVEPIDPGDYEELSEDQAKTMKNRAAAIKSIPDFEGMEVNLVKSKTKSSVAVYVPSQAVKRALIIHFELLLLELPDGNTKKLVKYLAGGAPFKIKLGAPGPQIELRRRAPTLSKKQVKKLDEKLARYAAVGGGGSVAAAAAPPTPASSAVAEALEEGEGDWEPAGGARKARRTLGKKKDSSGGGSE